MIVLSQHTADTLSSQTKNNSWVMFIQESGGQGAIKIEGVSGARISRRLREIADDNAHETFLIGLLPTTTPDEDEAALCTQFGGDLIHGRWFRSSSALIVYVHSTAQDALNELLAATDNVPDGVVDIDTIAAMLGIAVPTVRRMVKARQIPCLRAGAQLRFVPADVIESLQRRR